MGKKDEKPATAVTVAFDSRGVQIRSAESTVKAAEAFREAEEGYK